MTKTITATGKRGALVQVEIVTYPHGVLTASAETEHLTECQFIKATQKARSDYEIISLGQRDGYWYARGGRILNENI